MKIDIDNVKCARCGRCATVCPAAVFKADDGKIEITHPDTCIGCGHCLDVCATGAISHETIPQEKVHKINREILPDTESLMELIRSRRSNRTFTDTPIPEDALATLKEAALYAPTAENKRQVQVRFITSKVELQSFEQKVMSLYMFLVSILNSLPIRLILKPFMRDLYARIPELMWMHKQLQKGKRPCTVDASAIMLITAPKDNMFGYQDCNLAYQNASLVAETMGISQVYLGFVQTAMGIWGVKKTAKILGIPTNQKVYAIMGLGIPKFRYINYTERN